MNLGTPQKLHEDDPSNQGPTRGPDGLWYWPDGSPVTIEDLERITPQTQIVPHEPEVGRAPKPGRDFEIPDIPPRQPPRHHPLIGPMRDDIDRILDDPPPFQA